MMLFGQDFYTVNLGESFSVVTVRFWLLPVSLVVPSEILYALLSTIRVLPVLLSTADAP